MKENLKKLKIGFIGQGWIGKNYADDFLRRGYSVTRYSKEEPYIKNRTEIAKCDIVFIAVPTPTTPRGFDARIVKEVLGLIGKDKIAVIKSTLLPGTTEKFQKEFPGIFIIHSPEFLTQSTARHDVEHPERNIIGIPKKTPEYMNIARKILDILPKAEFEAIWPARDAEFFKYVRNCFFYTKVVYMNLAYDLAKKLGIDWQAIIQPLPADPWMGPMHNNPIHKSGRGAGGNCLVKDFKAFKNQYNTLVKDPKGKAMLQALEEKNIQLLKSTKKDLDILKSVYGK